MPGPFFIVMRARIAYAHDIVMAAASFVLSLLLRLGGDLYWYPLDQLVLSTAIFTGVAAAVFWSMRMYRGVWRYASLNDLLTITRAVSLAILVFFVLMFVLTRLEDLPRSLPLINWFVLIALLGGPRFLYRMVKDRRFEWQLEQERDAPRAGTAGRRRRRLGAVHPGHEARREQRLQGRRHRRRAARAGRPRHPRGAGPGQPRRRPGGGRDPDETRRAPATAGHHQGRDRRRPGARAPGHGRRPRHDPGADAPAHRLQERQRGRGRDQAGGRRGPAGAAPGDPRPRGHARLHRWAARPRHRRRRQHRQRAGAPGLGLRPGPRRPPRLRRVQPLRHRGGARRGATPTCPAAPASPTCARRRAWSGCSPRSAPTSSFTPPP